MIIFVNGSLSRNRTKEVTKPLNEFGCESPKELGGFFMLKFLEMKNEIWKDVVDYEESYQVSNLGRVKSLKYNRKKILKLSLCGRGYLQVNLTKNNISKTTKVHKLVAIAFLNHIPCGMTLVVDHINNNQTDNRVDNLQIITQKENSLKSHRKYSSKYVGVCWDKQEYKWKSQIRINGKLNYLGRFVNEQEASQAYQNALATI
jgi:hypothetical protein